MTLRLDAAKVLREIEVFAQHHRLRVDDVRDGHYEIFFYQKILDVPHTFFVRFIRFLIVFFAAFRHKEVTAPRPVLLVPRIRIAETLQDERVPDSDENPRHAEEGKHNREPVNIKVFQLHDVKNSIVVQDLHDRVQRHQCDDVHDNHAQRFHIVFLQVFRRRFTEFRNDQHKDDQDAQHDPIEESDFIERTFFDSGFDRLRVYRFHANRVLSELAIHYAIVHGVVAAGCHLSGLVHFRLRIGFLGHRLIGFFKFRTSVKNLMTLFRFQRNLVFA